MRLAISLIGMPGGGKSTVGRHLARALKFRFVDLDTAIERAVDCTIAELFEREGEARFRDVEQSTLAHLLDDGDLSDVVLATGGGAVLREANRAVLHARSTVIYLRSTPEELARRLRNDRHRPLLQVPDPLRKLRELYRERDPLYRRAAHFIVETGRPSVPTLVGTILMQLELAGLVDPSRVPSPVGGPRD